MKYDKTQGAVDKMRGVVRVIGVCFEDNASDAFIEEVISEVMSMETIAPGLMTAKALSRYMESLDEYFLERMAAMPIGSSFNYKGCKITRWSDHTYNGKSIDIH